MNTPTLRRAARLADLESGVPTSVVMTDGERLCLVRHDETVYAMVDRCPHRDFPLSGGEMVSARVLECQWHGARFDCRTGKVMQGPATDDLVTYSVRVVNGEIFVGPRRF